MCHRNPLQRAAWEWWKEEQRGAWSLALLLLARWERDSQTPLGAGGGVFSLAGGQSTAWGFCDMSFPGFSSLAMSCYQSQPSPEMDREPTGLGQSKDQTYYYFISFHLLRVSTSSHTRKGGGTEGEGQGEPHACSMPREEPDMSLDLTTLRS